MFTDFRLRVIRFFRKNSKIIFIVICVWGIVFLINMFLKYRETPVELQTTYEPHTAVINDSSSVPKSVSNSIEDMIEEYIGYCNNAEWSKAFNMLSETCKKYAFDDDIESYMEYVYTKMPTPKKYAIQDYSNDGNTYIYQIKYTDDMLATGLNDSSYKYTEEKMVFKKKRDGSIEMSVGNIIDYAEIKNISENEYLKIDVKEVVKYYSIENYIVKFTNRSDYTIVIADGQDDDEVVLSLSSSETRARNQIEDIVLKPNESKTLKLTFLKFYDNGDDAKSLNFNSIRVMEKYSGTENVDQSIIQSEIQNAISKFSVSIPVTYKD